MAKKVVTRRVVAIHYTKSIDYILTKNVDDLGYIALCKEHYVRETDMYSEGMDYETERRIDKVYKPIYQYSTYYNGIVPVAFEEIEGGEDVEKN